MNELVNKLNKIINNNYRDRFATELQVKEERINSGEYESANITLLKQILENFDAQNVETNDNVESETKQPLNIFVVTDNMTYGREWKKLGTIHKMIKIKEYFDFLPKSEFKDKLIRDIEIIINTKKFKDPDHVIYDAQQQQITYIPSLEINNSYEVVFNL